MIFTNVSWTTQNLILLVSLSIPLLAVIAGFWHAAERNRREMDLKESMIHRGLPADEIERVIKLQRN